MSSSIILKHRRFRRSVAAISFFLVCTMTAGCCIQGVHQYSVDSGNYGRFAYASFSPSWTEHGIPILLYWQNEDSPYNVSIALPKHDLANNPYYNINLAGISFYTNDFGWSREFTSHFEKAPIQPDSVVDLLTETPNLPVVWYTIPPKSLLIAPPLSEGALRERMNRSQYSYALWIQKGITLKYLAVRYSYGIFEPPKPICMAERVDVVPVRYAWYYYPLPGLPYWRHGP